MPDTELPVTAADPLLAPSVVEAQRHSVRVLIGAQVVGSVAVASGITMGGLLMEDVTGSQSAAGFAQAASTLGSALLAIPAARLAAASGRRLSY